MCLVLECLGLNPSHALQFSFLLMCTQGGSKFKYLPALWYTQAEFLIGYILAEPCCCEHLEHEAVARKYFYISVSLHLWLLMKRFLLKRLTIPTDNSFLRAWHFIIYFIIECIYIICLFVNIVVYYVTTYLQYKQIISSNLVFPSPNPFFKTYLFKR